MQFPAVASAHLPHNCEVAARLPRLPRQRMDNGCCKRLQSESPAPRRGGAMSEGLEAGTKAVNSLEPSLALLLGSIWIYGDRGGKSDGSDESNASKIFKV